MGGPCELLEMQNKTAIVLNDMAEKKKFSVARVKPFYLSQECSDDNEEPLSAPEEEAESPDQDYILDIASDPVNIFYNKVLKSSEITPEALEIFKEAIEKEMEGLLPRGHLKKYHVRRWKSIR